MSEDVRDLGPIEGHEIGVGTAPPPPPSGSPPSRSPLPVPAQDGDSRRPAGAVKAEAVEAWRDIRDAHRRGPRPNSRPLPNWVKRLAWVLDDAIEVPGTGGRRFGIDGIMTLVPGIGDAAGVALSMVVVSAGVLAGVSIPTILRMLVNVTFEGVVGLIPFGGAVFDMAYKANDRNVRLIEAELADRTRTRRSSIAILFALVLTSIVGFVMMLVLSVLSVALFAWFLIRVLG